MEEVLKYLKECGVFYIATTEGDQARVRPFGAVTDYEGKLYIVTNNKKKIFQQMLANPKIEICGMRNDTWLRLEARAVHEDNKAVREKMLAEYPSLSTMYAADDGLMEVLYLTEAAATVCSFTKPPVVTSF